MRFSLSLSSPHNILRFSTLSLPHTSPSPPMASGSNSLIWFRKGILIHDKSTTPALEHASKGSDWLFLVFVIDPHYMEPNSNASYPGSTLAGVNRIQFLLESLQRLGSRLLVLNSEPSEVLLRCLKEWNIKKLCVDYDIEPYYQALDVKVKNYASAAGIEVFSPVSVSHTLFNPADIIQKLVGWPSLASSPLATSLPSLPSIGNVGSCEISNVPTFQELDYEDIGQDEVTPFRAGESEALKRLRLGRCNE